MEKIKRIIKNSIESEKGRDILVFMIVILVGLGSFELGRLSKQNSGSGVKIEYSNQNLQNLPEEASAISAVNSLPTTRKNFFASSKGKKYYSIGCSGGKTIKQENRVYFATKEEAERAGYMLSH